VEYVTVRYVQGAPPDRWHWCKNCPQYPSYFYEKRSRRPNKDLCDQCKALEDKKNCEI
jgi:hypothetical protein